MKDERKNVCYYACDIMSLEQHCVGLLFSLGSPSVKIVESPLVTNSPSGAMGAFLIRNLISLFMSPALFVGVLPKIRCLLTDQQESLFSWAESQAALLKNDESAFMGAHLAAGSMTVSDKSLINLCIEHDSA